ncbi:MAG TPA: aminotransferase class IV [Gemmatimonadaceae bacterium]|jgi:branched-chain amino acid aminotransferase|nr:aminotransferase class IV [Gemmatimonadaceae bacterium]
MNGAMGEEEMRAAPRRNLIDDDLLGPAARTKDATRPAVTLPMVWVNGERAASDAMHVSALDRGFTLADGVFETMLVRHGVVFRLGRHLQRLRNGASVLRIGLPCSIGDWLEEPAYVVERSTGVDAAAVRLTVSRGPGAQGLAPRRSTAGTVVITADVLPAFPTAIYEQGLSALTASARRDERALTSGVKTLAYTETIAALARAREDGAAEVIFLDTEGHVSEASASNVFIVSGGALVAPPLSCGVLPGITREAIIELAATRGVQVTERRVEPSELAGADEAFLTSSLRGIAPLVRMDGRAIGSGSVGPLTRDLSAAYTELVESECMRERRRLSSMVR